MIRVTCAECGEDFEIGDDFAGVTEFCPSCGALNDIPDSQIEEDEPAPPVEAPTVEEPMPRGWGIPGGVWWTVFAIAVGLFIAGCVFLFSDNWESRNVELLSDATNRGDDFLAGEDFANAAAEYQFVLDTVGHRKIESSYIEQLIERSDRGVSQARERMRAGPTTLPAGATTRSAVAKVSPATPAAAGPDGARPEAAGPDLDSAMKEFQRNMEAFGRFVRQHEVVFRDNSGGWRRRRYVVWEESYDPPEMKVPLKVVLSFNVGSQITEPHFSRVDASADENFVHDESPRIVQCQTTFEWSPGRWKIGHHDVNAQKEEHVLDDVRLSLDDFFELERNAFGVVGK